MKKNKFVFFGLERFLFIILFLENGKVKKKENKFGQNPK